MNSYKSIFPKTAFVALLLFSSGNFLLGQTQPIFTSVTGEDTRVRFAGSEGDTLVFEVQLDNLPAKGTSLTILDDKSNIIFEERILKSTHTCRYKVARNNMEMITFKISGKTIAYHQSFTINFRLEEKLEVKKV